MFTQYLDIYRQHRSVLDAHAPAVLNSRRPQAYDALLAAEPAPALKPLLAPDYGINLERRAWPADIPALLRCDIPHVSTWLAAVVNDRFAPGRRLAAAMPPGVTICPLSQAPADLIEPYYASIAPLSDPAVALNTLLAQDGVLIHLSPGVRLPNPIQIVNLLNAPLDMMAVRRLLIILEPGASAQIITCDHTATPHRYLASQVTEIHLADGASLDLADLEESTPLTSRLSSLYARQHLNSRLTLNTSTLLGGQTLNSWNVDILGSGADTLLGGMVIGSGEMHAANSTLVTHHAPHSVSNQIFKYILNDNARGSFDGAIRVDYGAHHTSAYQSNRNILASSDARMHTQPQLEIYCDDVKCSHGAATGQLDQLALFYMRQRGIPLPQARTMLMQAFMADVIDTLRIPSFHDRLRHLVDRRLSSDPDALCSSCPTN